MSKGLTIADTRKMSIRKIEVTLGEHVKKLKELGMDHTSACGFISDIMNLGIAAHEKVHNVKQE